MFAVPGESVLGHEPIPRWKAHTIDFAATKPWLKGLITAMRSTNRESLAPASKPAADEAPALRDIPLWHVPLYTVCVAEDGATIVSPV
jgi:hypothetical protein